MEWTMCRFKKRYTGHVALAGQNGRSHRVCLDFFAYFFYQEKK